MTLPGCEPTATSRSGRPWLVLVTGEPGSGKTALGLQLAATLRLPFLNRDHIRGGLLATDGLWTNQLHDPAPREAAVDVLVDIAEHAAGLGVSVVLELVVTPTRVHAFRRLQDAGNCLVLLTSSTHARLRADRRDRSDPLLSRPEVRDALGHRSIESYLQNPERDAVGSGVQTEFDLPLLRVLTDDGYAPRFEAIVDWLVGQTRR